MSRLPIALPMFLACVLSLSTLLCLACTSGGTHGANPAESTGLTPLLEEPALVELAPYMGSLQTLAHKLSLSVAARNAELAAFYGYESIEALKTIQEEVPEYRGQPIAVLIDRMALGAAQEVVNAAQAGDIPRLQTAQAAFIRSCNACHATTQHGFIRITDDASENPFNQDFRP